MNSSTSLPLAASAARPLTVALAGNPNAGKVGATARPLINPPSDTEASKTAAVVSTYTLTEPNLAPAETWTSGRPDSINWVTR